MTGIVRQKNNNVTVDNLEYKRVVVVGLGRSGVGAANLLNYLGAYVTVTDVKESNDLEVFLNRISQGVDLRLGENPMDLLEESDLVVISPGVPLNTPFLETASRKKTKIIGELELAYQIVQSIAPDTLFIALTGTNGKSTTVTMLYEMIKNSGLNTVLAGNIGNAITEEVFKWSKGQVRNEYLRSWGSDIIVTEVSSFQLESIGTFKPGGASILNITPDHMDRYPTMKDYIDAKCRIFLNQVKGDFIVLNADDPVTEEIEKKIKDDGPEVFYFSTRKKVRGSFYKNGYIYFNIPDFNITGSLQKNIDLPTDFKIMVSDLNITGMHNIENALAAALMALLSGCSVDAIYNSLRDFKGLEHRLEFVDEIDGIRFINDSKGTNVGAVARSLEAFDNPVVLIAGGMDKNTDFSVLRPLVRDKVKAMILIGESKVKISSELGDVTEVFMEDDLINAVFRANDVAMRDDVVLLSPGCSSFDMFKDYTERGRIFKEGIIKLKE